MDRANYSELTVFDTLAHVETGRYAKRQPVTPYDKICSVAQLGDGYIRRQTRAAVNVLTKSTWDENNYRVNWTRTYIQRYDDALAFIRAGGVVGVV